MQNATMITHATSAYVAVVDVAQILRRIQAENRAEEAQNVAQAAANAAENDNVFVGEFDNPPGWRRARLERLPSGEWRRDGRLTRVRYNYD